MWAAIGRRIIGGVIMKKLCLLIGLLLLLGSAGACGIGARQCNYQNPQANYQQDDYQCKMLTEARRANTAQPDKQYGMGGLWYSDCMSARGWQRCRE